MAVDAFKTKQSSPLSSGTLARWLSRPLLFCHAPAEMLHYENSGFSLQTDWGHLFPVDNTRNAGEDHSRLHRRIIHLRSRHPSIHTLVKVTGPHPNSEGTFHQNVCGTATGVKIKAPFLVT